VAEQTGTTERITTYQNDGLTFDVLDEGPVDGDVVVLLHGFPERASSWRLVAPLLHARGLRTLAPDQRGYSPGARPPRRRDYRTPALVGDVAALIELAGGRAHVVGHDWGAAVAWGVAIQRPDLVRTLTAMAVPHPVAFLSSMVTSRQGLKSYYMGLFQLPGLAEWAGSKPGGPMESMLRRSRMSQDDVQRFRAEIVEYGALPGGLAWYRALPMMDRSLIGTRVTVPTTMVWSDGDDFIDRAGVDRTEKYVDAPYELVVLDGVSHWMQTEAPEACAEAVLRRVESVAG
jgi:pimeloyl-ACP methyl ester carboxylesterase